MIETENNLPDFKDLLKEDFLLEATRRLGFEKSTPVQASSIPRALSGKDLIVQAETGSGKTVAYSIPLLAKLKKENKSKKPSSPLSLIVSPTRELALQVVDVVKDLAPELSVVTIIGGVDMEKQIRELKKTCDVVVGTPGRILDLMRQRELNLKSVGYFVLDEADEMLSLGFYEDVKTILIRLPDKRQGLFVSATISPRVAMLAETFLDKPERINVDPPESSPENIEHLYANVPSDLMAKPNALCDFIETLRPQSAIIFCNTKSDTTLVEAVMRRRGFDARRINSDLSQAQRTRIMKKIKNRELQFLVATDVAARGLDIEQIDLVINYAIHDQAESYIHRSGRTGRAGRKGKVISLVGAKDFGAFHQLKKTIDFELAKCELPSDDEVADARLAHLYETLRLAKLELTSRDKAVAKRLLKEHGIENSNEELEEVIAKLARHSLEHAVAQEKKALEDELKAEEKAYPEEEQKTRKTEDDKRQSKGQERDEKRERNKPKERKERARGEERGEKKHEKREGGGDRNSGNRDNGNRDNSSQQERSRNDRGGRDRRNAPRDRRDEEQSTIRLFINQGKAQGMTKGAFSKLSFEQAGIEREDIHFFITRNVHSFVDCPPEIAKSIIDNLNGIEYKGQELFIEKATEITRRPPRRHERS